MVRRVSALKRVLIKITALVTVLLLFAGVCSCSPKSGADDYCRINGVNIYFANAQTTEKWRASLCTLLSNVRSRYDKNGEGGVVPAVNDGLRFGLLDVNLDGVPELLSDLGGGSAGNAYYEVYDIFTGELIDTVNGGFDEEWCVYYNTRKGRLALVGAYAWRLGWDVREYFTDIMEYGEDGERCGRLLYSSYTFDMDGECTRVVCKTDGEACGAEAFAQRMAAFEKAYVRIPETGLKLFSWDDVCEKDDNVLTRAEKMAEALIRSGQKFPIPV
jgi:hypothetical protein